MTHPKRIRLVPRQGRGVFNPYISTSLGQNVKSEFHTLLLASRNKVPSKLTIKYILSINKIDFLKTKMEGAMILQLVLFLTLLFVVLCFISVQTRRNGVFLLFIFFVVITSWLCSTMKDRQNGRAKNSITISNEKPE